MVVQVAATDADDPTYGNSARVVYSIVHGQPYFSVEPKTGGWEHVQWWCSDAKGGGTGGDEGEDVALNQHTIQVISLEMFWYLCFCLCSFH